MSSELTNVKETLKSFYGLVGLLSTFIPGLSFFSSYVPVFFPAISIITSALALVVFVFSSTKDRPTRWQSKTYFIISCLLILTYIALIQFTTVEFNENNGDKNRYQIGFYKYSFSLTEEGDEGFRQNPDYSIKEILRRKSGQMDERIDLIWKKEYVVGAGLLSIIVFTLASLSWVTGFVLLARSTKT